MGDQSLLPRLAHEHVYHKSVSLKGKADHVAGYDFNQGLDYPNLLRSMTSTGFQASQLGRAADTVNQMVDVLVTTAGGIEEDFIKCMAPSFLGDFSLPGADLRVRGLNHIGNLVVPNDNYGYFAKWILPILDQLLVDQNEQGVNWTPSKLIARLGKELNDPDSVYYWAYRGSVLILLKISKGWTMKLFMLTQERLILGGGLAKHHICNANMMRNGADFAVYINTAQEYDASDSGARPDEAISWGKIKPDAKPVKVHCDASIAFPLLVAQTFVPRVKLQKTSALQNDNHKLENGPKHRHLQHLD
ncbi:hypothetical protein L7F22_058932 [Adiantum nelumboides]|nr:hypothetical protein [Adiantum nelumboides]